jgi:hypothetical protein
MRKLYVLIFFIILFKSTSAQTYQFKGKVLDKQTKKELPFVAVSIVGESKGTQTDIDGRFSLISTNEEIVVRFQYVGYLAKEVRLKKSIENEITLSIKENNIREVQIIAGENPANKIIKKVIEHKNENNPEKLSSFKYTSYNKFVFTGKEDTAIFPRAIKHKISKLDSTSKNYQYQKDSILNRIAKEKKSTDSLFEKQHLFITETVTQRDFLFPEKNKEQIKAVKISGLKNPMFVLIASQFQSFSFYKDYMKVLDKNYLSPISKGSTEKYFFALEDTLLQNDDSVFVISFKPGKGKNFDGLKGVLYINKDGYAVQNVIAEPEKSSYFKIKVQQQYEKISGVWFPTQLNTDLHLGSSVQIENRTMIGIGRTYIKDIEIGVDQTKKKFDGVVIDYDRKSIKNNSDSLLNKYRVDTLDRLEKQTYYIVDSIGKAEKLDEKAKLFDVITKGYIPYGYIQFDLKRIISSYNDYEGIRLGLGIGTSEKFSKYFNTEAYFGWGTKDHQFKYGGSLTVPIFLKQDIEWKASISKDVIESGGTFFRGDKKTKFDTYRNILVNNMDWQEGIESQLSIRSQKYLLHYLYASQYKRSATNAYFFTHDASLLNVFETREIGISTRWAYRETFMRQSKQRISLGTKYPVVWFNMAYAKSIDDNWKGDYWKFDLSIKKAFTIRNVGITHVLLSGGYIKGSVPYPFAYTGRSNYNGSFSLASQGYFETMRMNEFLSTQQVSLFVLHDFGKLLYQSKYIKPGIAISTAYGIGSLSNTTQHTGVVFKTMEKGYSESGLLLSDLLVLKSNIYNTGLGLGIYYRYGAYKNIAEKDNLAFKLNLSISF